MNHWMVKGSRRKRFHTVYRSKYSHMNHSLREEELPWGQGEIAEAVEQIAVAIFMPSYGKAVHVYRMMYPYCSTG